MGGKLTTMQNRQMVWLVTALFLGVWVNGVHAEWQVFDYYDGLPSSSVRSMAEDQSGILWFTLGGWLGRFDGITWSFFDITELGAGDEAEVLFVDRDGTLWLGASRGILRASGSEFGDFELARGDEPWHVFSICQDQRGDLWFGSSAFLRRYDGTNWTVYGPENEVVVLWATEIVADSSGNVWFGNAYYEGENRLLRFDGTTWAVFSEGDGVPDSTMIPLLTDEEGNVWFGIPDSGACRFDGQTWSVFTTEDGLLGEEVVCGAQDRDGVIWFGHQGFAMRGGLTRCHRGTWRTYTSPRPDIDPIGVVRTILEDQSGNIWFGTFEGAVRFDKSDALTYTTDDGLPGNSVWDIFLGQSGDMWVACQGGVASFNGTSWTTYTTDDGLTTSFVKRIHQDHEGNIWVGLTFGLNESGRGICRFDGHDWECFQEGADFRESSVGSICEDHQNRIWFGMHCGVAHVFDGTEWSTTAVDTSGNGKVIYDILEDSKGDMWFALISGGVMRFDGADWDTFGVEDGIPHNTCVSLEEDRFGNIWVGGDDGLSRFDGKRWTAFTSHNGLPFDTIYDVLEDDRGELWLGTQSGLVRYDGADWYLIREEEGLPDNYVRVVVEDPSAGFWVGSPGGLTLYEPDYVPPRTVFFSRPPAISTTRFQTATYRPAFGETRGVEFSYMLDGSDWAAWESANTWYANGLSDGVHTLQVRARDWMGNLEVGPATASFEIDATPPDAIVSSPAYGEAVRDTLEVRGTASDPRFSSYRLLYRGVGGTSWDSPEAILIVESGTPIEDGMLAVWDVSAVADGDYELRLEVADTLGLTGAALVTVIVDNEAPWGYETTPARIAVASGGDVYTTNREVHLYFAPRAFSEETVIFIEGVEESTIPDTLSSGAVKVLSGYDISWEGAALKKVATLEMKFGDQGGGSFSLYLFPEGGDWQRLGGTVDHDTHTISAAITQEGIYALFSEESVPVTGTGLSEISMSPRVFSPTGAFANEEVAISFSLGRSGPVTVKVYNRAGRLVKEVASGKPMNPGANLVRWNGRDSDGGLVPDGLYLITVEALKDKQVKTLAVVR
jgi:ligand-binding sensor domain-containing protein